MRLGKNAAYVRWRTVMIAAGVVAIATAGGSASAGDGRFEINQACVATGCFPTDDPGLPVTLESAGSYVLTSNITGSAAGAIAATVAGVRLDLNGFTVAGPGTCAATLGGDGKLVSTDCTGTAGTGISGVSSLRNGIVRGFATGIGPPMQGPLAVDGVTVRETSSAAIIPGGRLILTDSVVSTTSSDGVSGQSATAIYTVRGCLFERNTQALYLANGVASDNVFVENDEALRSNVGGSALVVNNGFLRNVTALGGSGPRYRSNVFEETTNALGGTNLGDNTCNVAACP